MAWGGGVWSSSVTRESKASWALETTVWDTYHLCENAQGSDKENNTHTPKAPPTTTFKSPTKQCNDSSMA